MSDSGGRVIDAVQSSPERAEYPTSSTVAVVTCTKPRSMRSAHAEACVATANRA